MSPRSVLSVGNFFSSLHFFLVVYIVGPYLATLLPVELTGIVLSVGAIITLGLFPFMPHFVRKYGAKKLAVALAFMEAIVLTILSGYPAPAIAIAAVAISCALSPLIAYQLDLLLEATVKEEGATGRIRTFFLTFANLALVLSPLIAGHFLDGTDRYDIVFFVAAISLTPFIMLFLTESLPEGEPPHTHKLRATCICMTRDPDLRAVALANGVLQFFFHLAPLYVPLYLHTALGMPWDQLGWVFVIALLPYIFLEYPAGWLADKVLGDRGLLIAGFVLIGGATAALGFVTAETSFAVLVAILLLTRVGAAFVEAMVEGHFFRRVSERDANTVGVFRMIRPMGALIAPLIGSLILALGSYPALFLASGAAILVGGVWAASRIQDIPHASA